MIVRTAKSFYIIQGDPPQVMRTPTTGHEMRRDAEFLPLIEVIRCEVGEPLEMLVRLREDRRSVTFRRTSPVISIEE